MTLSFPRFLHSSDCVKTAIRLSTSRSRCFIACAFLVDVLVMHCAVAALHWSRLADSSVAPVCSITFSSKALLVHFDAHRLN
jgi:hypothetical protein